MLMKSNGMNLAKVSAVVNMWNGKDKRVEEKRGEDW
jgi:hypothetical protein